MQWLGANQVLNVKKNVSSKNQEINDNNIDGDAEYNLEDSNADVGSIRHETVEAALNRLSKSYDIAMESFGAWNKLDNALFSNPTPNSCETTLSLNANNLVRNNNSNKEFDEKKNDNTKSSDDPIQTLNRIGLSARRFFEEAILLDPLIGCHFLPTFQPTFEEIEKEYYAKITLVQDGINISHDLELVGSGGDSSILDIVKEEFVVRNQRSFSAKLTSDGNKSTVQNIAVLSLVNYADLILSGLPPRSATTRTILDRGIVPPLRCFGIKKENNSSNADEKGPLLTKSCWSRKVTVLRKTTSKMTNSTQIPVETMEDVPIEDSSMNLDQIKQPLSVPSSPNKSSHIGVGIIGENSSKTDEVVSEPVAPFESETSIMNQMDCSQDNDVMGMKDVTNLHPTENVENLQPTDDTVSQPTRVSQLIDNTVSTSIESFVHELDELEKDSVRLALVAYLDATSIDGSDPTVWLKLACASRRLGRILCSEVRVHMNSNQNEETPSCFMRYRRLEKYALEKAISCRSAGEAPNRTAVRAFREWEQEETQLSTPYSRTENIRHEREYIVIDVTTYSWTYLAKQLLKVCYEGSKYTSESDALEHSKKTAFDECDIASPNISLVMTPLLELQPQAITLICSYLTPSDLWRFETSCRAILASIKHAKSIIENSNKDSVFANCPDQTSSVVNPATSEVEVNTTSLNTSERRAASRASSRVRSQLIVAEKRAERSKRRQSVGGCLVAAIFGCTKDNEYYLSLVAEGNAPPNSNLSQRRYDPKSVKSLSDTERIWTESSSLATFVSKWRGEPRSTAIAVLFSFVAHVAIHVSNAFSNDPSESLILSNNLLECFDIMATRRKLQDCLVQSWHLSNNKVPPEALLTAVDLFALDVLHAELRLKRCEEEDAIVSDFDSDGSFLSSLLPNLLTPIDNIERSIDNDLYSQKCWFSLKARCLWLIANFYLWRSKISPNVTESLLAEREGLRFIDETIDCLNQPQSSPIEVVLTPHLESRKRKEGYWKEISQTCLVAFSHEVQASSVVLRAQEQFLEVVSKIDEEAPLSNGDMDALFAIGLMLFERYDTPAGLPSSNHVELVDNFLSVHGTYLKRFAIRYCQTSETDEILEWFEDVICFRESINPSLLKVSNPCILTILLNCLQAKNGKSFDIVILLTRIVITITEQAHGDSSLDRVSSLDNGSSRNIEEDALFREEENGQCTTTARERLYAILIYSLIKNIKAIFCEYISVEERERYVGSADCLSMISNVLSLSARWFEMMESNQEEPGNDEDVEIICSLKDLMKSIICLVDDPATEKLKKQYFTGLVDILVSQRRNFTTLAATKPTNMTRQYRLRLARRRSDTTAIVSCEIGLLLSKELFTINSGKVYPSILVSDLSQSQLAALVDNILCLWRVALGSDTIDGSAEKSGGLSAYLDRLGRDRIRLPLAVAVIGLCGSAISTLSSLVTSTNMDTKREPDVTRHVSLAEFYDSDASSRLFLVDDSDDEQDQDIMRVVVQSVHCMNSIINQIPESDLAGFSFLNEYVSSNGPLLPLVVCRVANHFSSILLTHFVEDKKSVQMALWSQEYPYGTKTIGQIVDSVLHKAYKHLHGFSLASSHVSDVKDTAGPVTPSVGGKKGEFPPENVSAAISLYRCIIRTYAQGRRTPPKAALDVVLDALPDVDETSQSAEVRKFLFSDTYNIELNDLVCVLKQSFPWEDRFGQVIELVKNNASCESSKNDVIIARQGISSFLAQGPIPSYADNGDASTARIQTASVEEELAKKFTAVVDDLRFNNINSFEGWFKASQCMVMKADLVADRIGLSKGYSRNENYCVPKSPIWHKSLNTQDLETRQERESLQIRESWIETIGNDLSLFVKYKWSSLQSLECLSIDISRIVCDDKNQSSQSSTFGDIDALLLENDVCGWQEALGSIFVSSLRQIAYRCICMAMFVVNEGPGGSKNWLLISEITESLGIMLYSELLGSQSYGYPMHITPDYKRRELAKAALVCFEHAVEVIQNDTNKDSKIAWDLYFMIGKCHEKIAKTYSAEKFCRSIEMMDAEEVFTTRKFEYHMSLALQAYQSSVLDAKESEKSGNFVGDKDGGSSHGAAEAVYRLHASRLKCLIGAINHTSDRELAKEEALRLTECHWYLQADDVASNGVRDRIWRVLADIVSALAQCRLDQPFFHRSVYRYAQALMWAPVFYDPVHGRSLGSLGTVPPTWSFKLRGLNHATDAASSAVVVISSLFEKRRSQLCAVWVTESATMSAFQTLNNCVRKYDSLRGKYIAAYVDNLRICKRTKELETFLRWAYSTCRDLPSFFAATAKALCNKPKQHHSHDCLPLDHSLASRHILLSAKRVTNCSLAAVISDELIEMASGDDAGALESKMKIAYACFLRLNCDPAMLISRQSWKYQRSEGVKDVVEALNSAYLRLVKKSNVNLTPKGWNAESRLDLILPLALQKCKELFPTLSSSYFSMKKVAPKAQKNGAGAIFSKKSFEVTVPDGLKEGDTFVTFVDEQEVLVTVPQGGVRTFRIALDSEHDFDESERTPKKQRIE